MADLASLAETDFSKMTDKALTEAMSEIIKVQEEDRRENQIIYYKPSQPKAYEFHKSNARVVAIGGGNGSGKTQSSLVEIIALATGVFPHSIAKDLRPKFRGPVQCRIVVESITNTLETVIIPFLQWWRWAGVDEAGGDRGHWGWVPRNCLKSGNWDKSWSAKNRLLTILCRDPDDPNRILGESTIVFNSHDQDPSDFASGDFHHVMMDEPPRLAIWRENEARTMRVKGRLYLAMTWPDDPAIPVDWIFDEVYEKGVPGPNKKDDVDWFELWTTENMNLNQEAVHKQMESWSEEMKRVRIYGQPIRFSNRIHPMFTDVPMYWSIDAKQSINPVDGKCPITNSLNIIKYCHVDEFDHSGAWPVIFALDPHPRKPHMFTWVQCDPSDDLWVIHEGEVDGDCTDVRKYVEDIEEQMGLYVVDRIMDPNMGRSPSGQVRGITWQDEFASAGLHMRLADDGDVGRSRINEYLKPDSRTLKPRIVWNPRCHKSIFQMKRYVWDNFKRQDERGLKQKARELNDDFPTLLKYVLNTDPNFRLLHGGAPTIHRNVGYKARVRVG